MKKSRLNKLQRIELYKLMLNRYVNKTPNIVSQRVQGYTRGFCNMIKVLHEDGVILRTILDAYSGTVILDSFHNIIMEDLIELHKYKPRKYGYEVNFLKQRIEKGITSKVVMTAPLSYYYWFPLTDEGITKRIVILQTVLRNLGAKF